MDTTKFEKWLDSALNRHKSLTDSVCTIIENLLISEGIDYLSVTGRTKNKSSALDKIKRKSYIDPKKQMTDLSGIRMILYFESDVKRVSDLIERSFNVDYENSLNQDELLSTNQMGYRSVHYVCDLGAARHSLPEFRKLANLKFEFQVRTILQHAWAELAHDRNYKFSGKLPREIERNLFLYAGMLEIADKGFDVVSNQIDEYINSLEEKAKVGDLGTEINSLSVRQFVKNWAKGNDLNVDIFDNGLDELVGELIEFGISNLEELEQLIPKNYSKVFQKTEKHSTILGVVRSWMLLKDWRLFKERVNFDWIMRSERDQRTVFDHYFEEKELKEFHQAFHYFDEEEF